MLEKKEVCHTNSVGSNLIRSAFSDQYFIAIYLPLYHIMQKSQQWSQRKSDGEHCHKAVLKSYTMTELYNKIELYSYTRIQYNNIMQQDRAL